MKVTDVIIAEEVTEIILMIVIMMEQAEEAAVRIIAYLNGY